VPGSVVDHDQESDAYPFRGHAADDDAFRIVTLEEVLTEFPDVFLNFDIKQTSPAVPAYEKPLAEALRRHGRVGDVIVASFLDVATERFRAIAPEIHTSLGTNGTAEFYRAVQAGEAPAPTPCVALQVPRTFGDIVVVDERFVDAAHDTGLAVHVWTIDEPDEMELLIDVGVDAIMTDRPSALETALQRAGKAFKRT
jgi:glycerophosphoryl diester phosphodiesterase